MLEDLSTLISECSVELNRIGESWSSDRVKKFCLTVTGRPSRHFLSKNQLEALLKKLQQEPTALKPVDVEYLQKIEKEYPLEAALMALVYCSNWKEFVVLIEAYGVDDNPGLNEQFWFLLRARGYERLVMGWRSEYLKAQEIA